MYHRPLYPSLPWTPSATQPNWLPQSRPLPWLLLIRPPRLPSMLLLRTLPPSMPPPRLLHRPLPNPPPLFPWHPLHNPTPQCSGNSPAQCRPWSSP